MTSAMRSAHDLGPEDLIWDYMSRPRTEPAAERVLAAAVAGFAGIGLFTTAWQAMRDDFAAVAALDEALDSTGLVVANIEVARGWASPDGATDACLDQEALAYEMADRFGCRYMQAIGNYTGTIAEAAVGFGALCDRAAEHGLLVGIEWVPQMTNIENAATAAAIAGEADRFNGGYCFDSWHLTRSTNDVSDIDLLDPAKIFATQFNDGPIEPADPDYYTDTTTNRLLPGQGEFALVEMIRKLDHLGVTAPTGLEVISTELNALPAEDSAQATATAMQTVLTQARR